MFPFTLNFSQTAQRHGAVLGKLDLAVVAGNTGEGLQRQIQREDLIQNPHGVDVVIEEPAGVLVVKLIEVDLAAMGKGGMTDVMAQRNGLDEIQIQIQRPADGTGDPGYQLHMQTSPGDIIVFDKGEHLGLVGIAISLAKLGRQTGAGFRLL